MPYDPHLLVSWTQVYKAILSAPPPCYAENEWASMSSNIFGTPPPKAQLSDSVGNQFVVMWQWLATYGWKASECLSWSS